MIGHVTTMCDEYFRLLLAYSLGIVPFCRPNKVRRVGPLMEHSPEGCSHFLGEPLADHYSSISDARVVDDFINSRAFIFASDQILVTELYLSSHNV